MLRNLEQIKKKFFWGGGGLKALRVKNPLIENLNKALEKMLKVCSNWFMDHLTRWIGKVD